MAKPEPQPASQTPRRVSAWVKGFVVFHLAAITVWSLPAPPDDLASGKLRPRGSDFVLLFNEADLRPSPVKFYALGTGFWQYWNMFAPNPSTADIWCDAQVVHRSGRTVAFQYPRMSTLSNGQRFIEERYRKFYERISMPQNQALWPAFGQAVARLSDDKPDDPPVAVNVYHHWRAVAPPGVVQPSEYQRRLLFTYRVDQNALRSAEAAP